MTRAEVLLELGPLLGDFEEMLGALEAIVGGEDVDLEGELAVVHAKLDTVTRIVARVRREFPELEDSAETP